MPPGIPVATVGVDAAENAALLALSILALNDEGIRAFLLARRSVMRETVAQKDEKLRRAIEEL